MQQDGSGVDHSDTLLQQLQEQMNQQPSNIHPNDQIQTLRQQLLLQQLQQTTSSNNNGGRMLPSDLLSKLLVQLQTQHTQIDQMKSIIEQMRTIIENQQKVIQKYQEQYSESENYLPAFKEVTVEDLMGPSPQPQNDVVHQNITNQQNNFRTELPKVDVNSYQQLNSELQKTNFLKRKRREEDQYSLPANNVDGMTPPINQQTTFIDNSNDQTENISDDESSSEALCPPTNKTLVYRGLPNRKNMKKTDFKVSKWTLK
ncbi:Aatf [Acrasis kona]|uniref:Aatf n=1 Tax=Acrasis kona TaxID=1008807 RepID=A0AAW2YL07_9EUKA